MIYRVDDIIKDVRVSIDENVTSENLIDADDIETLTLNDLIHSKVLEAVEYVHVNAPYNLLQLGHNFEDEYNGETSSEYYGIHWGEMESGYVFLPPDFLRLVVFQMSDWERPVYTLLGTNSPEYTKQSSRIKAVRGTAQRPLCFLGVRPAGKVLEFYSCKSKNATVAKAVYVPYPTIVTTDNTEYVEVSEPCYDAMVYYTAGLVMSAQNNNDAAKIFFNKTKNCLEK